MNRKYDVVTVGLQCIDIVTATVTAGVLDRDQTIVDSAQMMLGGDALNQAIVLARLGALASETAGRSIRVQTTTPDAPELQRSASEINDRLEALRQFDIVQFIDHSTED